MAKFDSVIFDLDGTLWDTLDCTVQTFRDFKKRHSDITKDISEEVVRSGMGLTFNDIVEKYYGYLDKKTGEKYVLEAFNEVVENLKEKGGNLYPGLGETLKKLSSKCKLFIVSNCQNGYIESFMNSSNLGKYFTDYECNGNTKLEKGENIKLIIERNNCKNPVYVGDMIKDFEAAKFANIPFIYASYGFGNLKEYDYKLNEISDIISIIE